MILQSINCSTFFSLVWCLACLAPIYSTFADGWAPVPPVPIPGSTSANSANTVSSFDSTTGQFLVTWQDNVSVPTYAVYTVSSGTWSTPINIPGAVAAPLSSNIFSSFDPAAGKFLVTWKSTGLTGNTYSLYTVSGDAWSPLATIPGSGIIGSNSIFNSFDSTTEQFLVTWRDGVTGLPFYTVYTVSSNSWSVPIAIPDLGSHTMSNNTIAYTSFNSSTGQFLATWNNGASGNAYFSIYTVSGNSWSQPVAISTNQVDGGSISNSFDSTTGQYIAVWKEAVTRIPTYSIFNGVTWSTPAHIPGAGTLINGDIFSSFGSTLEQFFVTWLDTKPIYSTYTVSSGTWSTPTIIPSSSTAQPNVFSSFGLATSTTGLFLTTWQDFTSNKPTYSIFTISAPPSPTPTPSSNTQAIITGAQGAAQQNIQLVDAAITNAITQIQETGMFGVTEGTFVDTLHPYIIDSTIPYTTQVQIVPSWCQ